MVHIWHFTIRTVPITALLTILLSVVTRFYNLSAKITKIIGNFHFILLAQNKFHLLVLFYWT
jgi:hypothetical protein